MLHQHAGLEVERRERLVHHDEVGLLNQRARNRNALLHAAGKLERPVLREALQAHPLQHLNDPALALRLGHMLHRETEADIVLDRQPGKQRVILKHHHHARLRSGHGLAVEGDAAGRQRLETGGEFEQRALAATARTENGDEFALLDGQVDVAQRSDGEPACGLPDLADVMAGQGLHRTGSHHKIRRWICTSSTSTR